MLRRIMKWLTGFPEGEQPAAPSSSRGKPRFSPQRLLSLILIGVLAAGLFFWKTQSDKRAEEKAAQERTRIMEQQKTGPRRVAPRKPAPQAGQNSPAVNKQPAAPLPPPSQPQVPMPTGPKVKAQTPPMIQPKAR
ncbi:hypothetical protein [Acidaminococcus fermentans]|uniref:hypothetical protein n=1 Tax=Acidaminococcus fermentans TaxID=905 RepID=UPI00265FD57F|nr:hypothetical protein [Acidaminococcus fermentans]